jgi:hypothetical protein
MLACIHNLSLAQLLLEQQKTAMEQQQQDILLKGV